jgi:hypothetical protein
LVIYNILPKNSRRNRQMTITIDRDAAAEAVRYADSFSADQYDDHLPEDCHYGENEGVETLDFNVEV